MKMIAVDLDDTLNDFTATLRQTHFAYDEKFAVAPAVFDQYLQRIRNGSTEVEDLLSTEFSFFRAKIHLECYRRAKARADAVGFMRWLRQEGWRIVICTHRDLRSSYRHTKTWLDENGIPFDQIFRAGNKIVFCKLWGIDILVDDNLFNIEYGGRYGVKVYYPINDQNRAVVGVGARGFETFTEVRPWIGG
jgi:5'(3')-deoxyribonucleotidase